jgi:AcrR family transcriptional regulator
MVELTKREARKRKIKQNILQKSYILFVKNGYENTTVGEILKASEVSRRTFFKYFPTKQDLLHHFSREMVRVTRLKILKYADNGWSTKRRLNAYFKYSVISVKKTNEFAKILLKNAMGSLPKVESDSSSCQLEGIQEAFLELLRQGYEQGELNTSMPLEFHAQIVMGIYNSVIINWLNKTEYPLENRMAQAAKVALKAIS